MSGIADKLYEGAVAYGKIESTFELIVGGIVCLVFVVMGIGFITYHYTNNDIKTTGTILNVECKTNVDTKYYRGQAREHEVTTCNVTLEYVVNNMTYRQTVPVLGTEYSPSDVGKKIEVSVDPNNPLSVSLDGSMYMGYGGSISIVLGICVLASAWLNYYLTRKSKLYAAAQVFD